MKKLLSVLFITVTCYCNAQEKITLTTGDTLIGTVTKVDSDHLRITKADGTSILLLSNMVKKNDQQLKSSKIATTQIVTGCLINSVGIVLLAQSMRIKNDPIYDLYAGGEKDRQQKSIAAAGLGGVCMIIGTAYIIKGVKLKNERLTAGLSLNGIRVIYKI